MQFLIDLIAGLFIWTGSDKKIRKNEMSSGPVRATFFLRVLSVFALLFTGFLFFYTLFFNNYPTFDFTFLLVLLVVTSIFAIYVLMFIHFFTIITYDSQHIYVRKLFFVKAYKRKEITSVSFNRLLNGYVIKGTEGWFYISRYMIGSKRFSERMRNFVK